MQSTQPVNNKTLHSDERLRATAENARERVEHRECVYRQIGEWTEHQYTRQVLHE
jgi:hypothetical protein